MQYTKVSFQITPINDFIRDVLIAELSQFDYDSFEETENGINAYIPTSSFSTHDIEELQIVNNSDYSISFDFEEMPDQNWNETWEKYFFNPILIEDKCVVCSPFHTDIPQTEYSILIEPKMAFGTGHHETTGLMIKHILENDFTGKKVLDMGCGTGILGILCAMKNAENVVGIDIEEWAFNNANDNIQLNNIEQMQVYCGDASLLGKDKYDTILANINRNILLEDISKYTQVLQKGGTLFLSGFYNFDIEAIDAECVKNGLSKISMKEDNKWVAIAYTLS
ncbi:50S ribosomal protein L11 methyltransferase [Plebeiibacterium marinum]|uniref:Ribosomal protein L11 methyltransferase n=1 Tax=Plebeiibacterium marinum TaxID=2992111 RepID=A0AAE3SLA7_9BACT|nr:50S ribosomal protein L11 methyltransferase [Plebeiobacterium marinum]MCW3807249.1 50S ribosomal protein L11 methyltransferase [Plebeiobacterium marinum]